MSLHSAELHNQGTTWLSGLNPTGPLGPYVSPALEGSDHYATVVTATGVTAAMVTAAVAAVAAAATVTVHLL